MTIFSGIAISIYRTTTLADGAKSTDITRSTLLPTTWTCVELNVLIFVANIPVLRSPLVALFKRIFTKLQKPRRSIDGSTPLTSTAAENITLEDWISARLTPSTGPSTAEP